MTNVTPERFRVVIVDDHPIVRVGLRDLIQRECRAAIVGEGASGEDAVRLSEQLQPDLVVMDISMAGMSGLEATRLIKRHHPEVRVLIVTTFMDEEYVRGALDAGADGYLLKHGHPRDISAGIRRVRAGERVLDPAVVQVLIALNNNRQRASMSEQLSPREREILQMLAEGSTSKEIAHQLGLRPKTVENHRARILDKLGAVNSAAAVRTALSRGVIRAANVSADGRQTLTSPIELVSPPGGFSSRSDPGKRS